MERQALFQRMGLITPCLHATQVIALQIVAWFKLGGAIKLNDVPTRAVILMPPMVPVCYVPSLTHSTTHGALEEPCFFHHDSPFLGSPLPYWRLLPTYSRLPFMGSSAQASHWAYPSQDRPSSLPTLDAKSQGQDDERYSHHCQWQ